MFERIAEGFAEVRREKGICPAQEKAKLLDGSGEATVCTHDEKIRCKHRGKQVVCEGEGYRGEIKTPYLCGYECKTES